MTEKEETGQTGVLHQVLPAERNTVVLSIPKLNLQVVALGLVALITVFQTFQLWQISSKAKAAPVKPAPAAVTNTNSSGSGADAPQSMVGGC